MCHYQHNYRPGIPAPRNEPAHEPPQPGSAPGLCLPVQVPPTGRGQPGELNRALSLFIVRRISETALPCGQSSALSIDKVLVGRDYSSWTLLVGSPDSLCKSLLHSCRFCKQRGARLGGTFVMMFEHA